MSKEIYDAVVAAMQPAEELGGPEGADYISLMAMIAEDAIRRMQTYASTADYSGRARRTLSQRELLDAQGFTAVNHSPQARPLYEAIRSEGGVVKLPHYGMAVKKVLDADEMWWSVVHVPLDGHGNVMQGEEWGDMGCGPGTPTSEYRSEAVADWLIEQLAKVPPAGAAEDRMWRLLEHARTRDTVEQLRAEVAALATAHPMQPIVIAPDNVIRFKPNKIIRWMLERGKDGSVFDLNTIASQDFSDEDHMQLAQLIGYSVSGYGDLSYASRESVRTADALAAKLAEKLP